MSVDLCKHLELPEICNACQPVKAGQNGHDPRARVDISTYVGTREEQEQEQEKPRLWKTGNEVRKAAQASPSRYWPVPGLLAPGLSLMFAKPKTGKTRLLVDVGWGVACGNPTLGNLATHEGDVLMILSETTHASLDDIWETTFPDEIDVPERLSVIALEDWQAATRLYAGQRGTPIGNIVEEWRRSVEKPVLVVIDNLHKCIAPYAPNIQNVVERERRMLDPIQEWANRHGICVVLVHHTNKGKLEKDTAWQTAANGSTAITAAPDDLFMLYGSEDGGLGIRYEGRSLGRKRDWTLFWRANRIHMFDTVEVSDRLGDQMRVVLEGLAQIGGEGSPKNVSDRTGVPLNTVQQYLIRLARNNLVVRSSHGLYRLGMVEEE